MAAINTLVALVALNSKQNPEVSWANSYDYKQIMEDGRALNIHLTLYKPSLYKPLTFDKRDVLDIHVEPSNKNNIGLDMGVALGNGGLHTFHQTKLDKASKRTGLYHRALTLEDISTMSDSERDKAIERLRAVENAYTDLVSQIIDIIRGSRTTLDIAFDIPDSAYSVTLRGPIRYYIVDELI